ncbi:MAG TPA: M13-type metalloendopeptidase, partial [Novosphingobium sp.]|nr:M13-type metalloendopeptidase [Novosphingobium sp.]
TVQDQVKAVITAAPAGTQYGALYASFMDEAAAERVGLAPLMADIAKVRAIADKSDFARYMGHSSGRFGVSLFDFDVEPDTADANTNVLWVYQGGIGLPERDYYFNAQFAEQRAAYVAYIERTLTAIGDPDPAGGAKAIMAFETQVAQLSWESAKRRDVSAINNPYSSAMLAQYAPGVDWTAFLAGAGIAPQKRLIAAENTAIKALAGLYAQTPLDTLKRWQAFHVASQASPYLTKAMVDSRFDFTRTLSGVTQNRPRWKRGVDLVNGSLGELVGQAYVARYFPPAAKAKMESLVANLKLAMADRIRANGWMGEATKKAALEKLARIDVMVGYPDKWRSYAALRIDAGDLYGNVERAGAFNAAYAIEDLGKPVNRRKWAMNAQTVNAYNGGSENKIVFPAGILQPPFFDPAADDAVNYGAIGAVIGHEISHGFDDQGRKIDASGTVRDWWSAQDAKRFEAEAKVFGDQYAKFEAAPGAFVNPGLTMGENIADFAGVQVALDAWRHALAGKTPPVVDGLSGEQRFFLAFAQVWRSKKREAALRNQVTTDPHSPERFRIIGPLRNVDAWYKAFDVAPGDKLYIAPDQRARIW